MLAFCKNLNMFWQMSHALLHVLQWLQLILACALLYTWHNERNCDTDDESCIENEPMTPREIPKALMLNMIPSEDKEAYDLVLTSNKSLPNETEDLAQPTQSVPIVDITDAYAEATSTIDQQDPWEMPNFFAVFHKDRSQNMLDAVRRAGGCLVRPEKILAVPGANETAVIGALMYTNLVATDILQTPLSFKCEGTGTGTTVEQKRPTIAAISPICTPETASPPPQKTQNTQSPKTACTK